MLKTDNGLRTAELELADLKKVAIHEAALIWMLKRTGGWGQIHLWRNPSLDQSEMAYLGGLSMWVSPQVAKLDPQTIRRRNLPPTPAMRGSMVGMAGFLGELIHECGPLSRRSTSFSLTLRNALSEGAISPSEQKLICPNISESLVWLTYKLLWEHWDEVTEIANQAIEMVQAEEAETLWETEQ